ncbi:hypothetical protein RHSIM_Rhsim12G0081100 [Rhododendron simsii]|uniref:Uncharacterized protein n=1 Tax=Rhododendron simsii TaxID=118357 RepID=A0A834GAG0_RHOSS|nr:hypothetical protein RHSIM_Rhsim12G0081100 [Rhododendron simsii]
MHSPTDFGPESALLPELVVPWTIAVNREKKSFLSYDGIPSSVHCKSEVGRLLPTGDPRCRHRPAVGGTSIPPENLLALPPKLSVGVRISRKQGTWRSVLINKAFFFGKEVWNEPIVFDSGNNIRASQFAGINLMVDFQPREVNGKNRSQPCGEDLVSIESSGTSIPSHEVSGYIADAPD